MLLISLMNNTELFYTNINKMKIFEENSFLCNAHKYIATLNLNVVFFKKYVSMKILSFEMHENILQL